MRGKLPEQVDPKRLAHQGATLVGDIPAAALRRLGAAYALKGDAHVDLHFAWSERRRARIEGEITATVASTCQRCLQEYETRLTAAVDLEIGEAPRDAEQDYELLLAADESLQLIDLVEDELLLEAPMIPLHARGECTAPAGADEAAPAAEDSQRKAFADLQTLWERTKK